MTCRSEQKLKEEQKNKKKRVKMLWSVTKSIHPLFK